MSTDWIILYEIYIFFFKSQVKNGQCGLIRYQLPLIKLPTENNENVSLNSVVLAQSNEIEKKNRSKFK